MKSILSIVSLLSLLILGCTENKNQSETTTDTLGTATVIEASTSANPQYSKTAIDNFPDYTSTLLTDDEFENEITSGIDKLIDTYKSIPLLTYQEHYVRERDYEGEYEPITETETVTETWFFDQKYKVKAYSKKYYREGEGRETNVLICFFSNDSLIALSDWRDVDSQIGMTYHKKILASRCPKCGIDVKAEAAGPGEVNGILNKDDLVSIDQVTTDLSILFDASILNRAQKSGDEFIATDSLAYWHNEEGKPYVIEYTVSNDLYNHLKFVSLIELFSTSGADIPDELAKDYLEADEMTSCSTLEVLERANGWFLLYKKFSAAGPGLDELYALSFNKDEAQMANTRIGSSFPSSGPNGGGEEYDYSYDPDKHILTVKNTTIDWDESSDQEISKTIVNTYKMDNGGSVVSLTSKE